MFARMKVGTRLALAFGVVVLLLGAMLAVSLTRMKSIQAGLLEITDVNNEELRAANAMNDAAHDALINLEGELLSSDLDKSRRLEEVRLEAAKRFETRDSRPTASETAFAPAHGGRKPQPCGLSAPSRRRPKNWMSRNSVPFRNDSPSPSALWDRQLAPPGS